MMRKAGFFPIYVLLCLAATATMSVGTALAGDMWFKVAGGVSGLAMDDINDGTFSFYDTSINGYNFPDLDSGFSLSFHMGSDINEKFSMGFSWDIQHGHVEGTDVDVTAKMKLDANFFMGHLYWTPMRGQTFSLGAAAGLGFVAANGTVEVEQGSVYFGEGDVRGSHLAYEVMGTAEYALTGSKGLQLTAGWRQAKIKEVDFAGSKALKEDGSNLELDYSGYTLKLGVIWRFNSGGESDIQ